VCGLIFKLSLHAPSVAYISGDVALGLCPGRSDKEALRKSLADLVELEEDQARPLLPRKRRSSTRPYPTADLQSIKYLVSGLPGSDLWTRGVPVDFILRLTVAPPEL
jgi:hypothetical protein